jgi:hypothetical protein
MAVETQLQGVRRVPADLQEAGAPRLIDEVDVVVVHADRRPLEVERDATLALPLHAAPRFRSLLGHPHQHHSRRPGESAAVRLHDVVLALPLLELDPWNAPRLAPGPQLVLERLGDLPEQGRRGDRRPAPPQEAHDPTRAVQRRHIAVQIHPINAIDGQRDVGFDKLCNVGHRRLRSLSGMDPIVPNRVRPALTLRRTHLLSSV